MDNVTASIGLKKYETQIHTATNNIIADEPIDIGGEDLGFSPPELLCASLAACTCATLRMYADRKGYQLDQVNVDVSFERDAATNTSQMVRKIKLTGNLSPEERDRILVIANSCFIHKTLSNPISISSSLVD
jgi:putative redox protein